MKFDNFSTTELKDFHLKVKIDIEVIQTSIIDNKDQYSGCESFSEQGQRLARIADYIKETYNEEVSPDIAGVESFVEKLKAGFKQVTEALKSKPNKQRLAVIKTAAYEATKAAKVYESTKWLDEQTFINIGNVKFQVPSIFKDVKTLDDAKKIIDGIFKQCETDFNANMKDMEKRLSTGLTLFNKYKSKEWDEKYLQEVKKALPIKPEISDFDKQAYLELVGTGYVPASIPVLTKDMVKDVSQLMAKLGGLTFKMETDWEIFASDTMDTSDFWDSSFWDNVPEETLTKVWDAVEWHRINDTLFSPMESSISKVLFELVKFLENWILYSVK
ncbi:hypothetical protein [Aeromonas phage ZPAH34]|uniref:hypothetical protein n=1 Tax=Aeromonas phage ZPAH34 TaxID=2924888 RepID=UPI00232924A9|nr:hypothetical protein PQD16_gp121 [Aeromonas phage ZPAH34]UOX39562.1 hypothetical protein [Aeromonas phage ZPAH34]